MQVPHCPFRHYKFLWVAIACFTVCTIPFSSVLRQDRIEPSVGKPALESLKCHLVACRQDDDEEEEEDEPVPDLFENWGTTESKVLGARRFVLKQEFQMAKKDSHAIWIVQSKWHER